jgi:hypothetical protein
MREGAAKAGITGTLTIVFRGWENETTYATDRASMGKVDPDASSERRGPGRCGRASSLEPEYVGSDLVHDDLVHDDLVHEEGVR